ncbi:unnamed protein product [Phytophthora lilii]|uniref:Unnamed protein product n=1 Tax=Phytophthora lilii TaxID=2077276 RepID=A0A9W6WTQ7_9STRA|nr:unnamed protein product [Phytophthora lilii]
MGPASVSDFLATGALQGAEHGQTHSSARAVAIAQASLSASKLSQSLPATTNPPNPPLSTAESGQTSSATPASEVPSAATAPAVFTQELHDNLNMFLKTATAYLVMLINDHNKESGP